LTARQRAWAVSISLNAIASPAALEPGPQVTLVRCRTVAKVDSIGLVRKWDPVLGGKVVEGDQLLEIVGDLPEVGLQTPGRRWPTGRLLDEKGQQHLGNAPPVPRPRPKPSEQLSSIRRRGRAPLAIRGAGLCPPDLPRLRLTASYQR